MIEIVCITEGLVSSIQRDATESPEREICGLLFGSETRIAEALATANVAADPAAAFEIDPQALFAALRAERAGGPKIIGCYHSHPRGDATPSARDAAAAEEGRLWLIMTAEAARLWRAGRDRFEEVAMHAV